MSAEQVKWASIDPRNGTTVYYSPEDSKNIEAAYQRKAPECKLTIRGNKFTIHFNSMMQTNCTGGARKCIRMVHGGEAEETLDLCNSTNIAKLLKIVEKLDKCIESVMRNPAAQHSTDFLSDDEKCLMLKSYNTIIEQFKAREYQEKYGFHPHSDSFLFNLRAKEPVPEYFANVQEQSMYQRKFLSLAGLRNLIFYGPEIFGEMEAAYFSGNLGLKEYSGHRGPHKMKRYTGNVVDLDETVLRCSDPVVLKTINKQNAREGKPTYRTSDEFGKSMQAKQLALDAAKVLIDGFCKEMKLTASQISNRCLDLRSVSNIPIVRTNRERGMHPVWQYINDCGVNSFHVNVPNMPDVYGALLLAPCHAVKAYLHIMQQPQEKRGELLRDYFEDCIADSCFNAKWKRIEEFNQTLKRHGTIREALGNLQKDFQLEFMRLYDNDNSTDEEEVELYLKLVEGCKAIGRSEVDGKVRPISRSDIESFVKQPNKEI